MQYAARSDKTLREEAKDFKVRPLIRLCALCTAVGLTLRLLHSNYKIIDGMLSELKAIGMAIWTMLCDAAHACADFVNYIRALR